MARFSTALLAALTALALALAGCGGDGGDGGEDTGTATGTTTTTTGTSTTGPGGSPGGVEPIYINGTVSGVVDCSLGRDNAAMATTESVPMAAANGSYELTVSGDDAGTATVCLAFGDEPFSSAESGTVPGEAREVLVGADGAPGGVDFSIRITPVGASAA